MLGFKNMGTPIRPLVIPKNIFYPPRLEFDMENLSNSDKLILLQYAINKYENEPQLMEKLITILKQKEIDMGIATLIATQQVRRIGPDVLQNNISHIGELPSLPPHLKSIIDSL